MAHEFLDFFLLRSMDCCGFLNDNLPNLLIAQLPIPCHPLY